MSTCRYAIGRGELGYARLPSRLAVIGCHAGSL